MKYTQKLVKKICDLIEKDTYSTIEICKIVDITEETFYKWKREKTEFYESIKKAKDNLTEKILIDCKNSLVKLINGYEYEEVSTILTSDGLGKAKIKEKKTIKKHVAPNLGAIIHFQTNKAPDEWKNKQTNEVTGRDGKELFPNIQIEIIDKREQIENTDN